MTQQANTVLTVLAVTTTMTKVHLDHRMEHVCG